MLLKYTLKNIISKPGRLAILLLCMTAACFAGFLSVDFGGSIKKLMLIAMTSSSGEADYKISTRAGGGIRDELFDVYGEVRYVAANSVNHREDTRTEEYYRYVLTDKVEVLSFSDTEKAMEMHLIPEMRVPGEGEIAISESYSERYGYNEGCLIMLADNKGNDIPLTVSSIYENTGIFEFGLSALISPEQMQLLTDRSVFTSAYVDLLDDRYELFEKNMARDHSEITLLKLYAGEDVTSLINNISNG